LQVQPIGARRGSGEIQLDDERAYRPTSLGGAVDGHDLRDRRQGRGAEDDRLRSSPADVEIDRGGPTAAFASWMAARRVHRGAGPPTEHIPFPMALSPRSSVLSTVKVAASAGPTAKAEASTSELSQIRRGSARCPEPSGSKSRDRSVTIRHRWSGMTGNVQ
jgi:hypothetical protein